MSESFQKFLESFLLGLIEWDFICKYSSTFMGAYLELGHENDLRSHIRFDIINSIIDQNHDTTQTRKYVEDWVQAFGDKFRINVQFVVPINLPPNRKAGFCKAIIEKIIERMRPTAGGYNQTTSTGGWFDGKTLYREKSITVNADIDIGLWEEIPGFMRLVIDDIQRDLKQKCVYVRIDNVVYGDPIDLLKIPWDEYPSIEEFGSVDPDCLDYQIQPTEKEIQPLNLIDLKTSFQVVKQGRITTRSSSNISANEVTVNIHNYADKANITKAQEDIAKLQHYTESPRIDDENVQHMMEAKDSLEQNYVSIDPKQELKVANKLVKSGRLDEAEGIYKRLERKFKLDNDEIHLAKNWYQYGYLEMTRGNMEKCYDFHSNAARIFQEHDENELLNWTLHQIGNALYYLNRDKEAVDTFELCLKHRINSGSSEDEIYTVQYMIAVYSTINGDYDKSRLQLNGCYKIFSKSDSEWHKKMQRLCKKNFAWLEYLSGNKKGAINMFEELLIIESTTRFKSCIHAALGRIYLEMKQPNKAEKHHRQCVENRILSGSKIGQWYENHGYTNPNKVWNYPPEDVSTDRYDLMCPI